MRFSVKEQMQSAVTTIQFIQFVNRKLESQLDLEQFRDIFFPLVLLPERGAVKCC